MKKLGCKHRLNLKALPLSNYLNPKAMSYPPVCSWWREMDLGMLGNDSVGDCVIAYMLHQIMIWNGVAHAGTPVSFTTDQAIQTYSAITGYNPAYPNTDQGTDPDTALSYWQKNGLFGHSIAGYVNLDITNVDQLRYALYVFGGIGFSINCPAYVMNVPAGGSWSLSGGDATIEGGHQIGLLGYGRNGFRLNSWSTTYTFNLDFVGQFGQAAQAAVSPDWIKQSGTSPSGLDLNGLLADLQAV
jgi:hypothetical protein